MGYFTPGDERGAGGLLELYAQWCAEGSYSSKVDPSTTGLKTPGQAKTALSMFDQLETGDVVELWVFTGRMDSKIDAGGGKTSVHYCQISLGYQQVGQAPDEHLLDRQQTDERASLRDTMTGASETVADALEIPVSWAELLLETYNWRPATAVAAFEDDPEAACLKAGKSKNEPGKNLLLCVVGIVIGGVLVGGLFLLFLL